MKNKVGVVIISKEQMVMIENAAILMTKSLLLTIEKRKTDDTFPALNKRNINAFEFCK